MKTDKKVTASYEMTNSITGSRQWYYVVRRQIASREQIETKFKAELNAFPAYQSKQTYVSSPIIVTDYRGFQIEEIKVNI